MVKPGHVLERARLHRAERAPTRRFPARSMPWPRSKGASLSAARNVSGGPRTSVVVPVPVVCGVPVTVVGVVHVVVVRHGDVAAVHAVLVVVLLVHRVGGVRAGVRVVSVHAVQVAVVHVVGVVVVRDRHVAAFRAVLVGVAGEGVVCRRGGHLLIPFRSCCLRNLEYRLRLAGVFRDIPLRVA